MSTAVLDQKVKRLTSSQRPRKSLFPFSPSRLWIEKEVADHPQTIRILNKLKGVEYDIVDSLDCLKRPTDIGLAKREMILSAHKGQPFKLCQGMGEGHVCCNYRVIDLVSGCPMECSYCVLQSYLANNPRTTIYVNVEKILADVSAFLSCHASKFYRIGTGELSDSLALDPIIDFASLLIPFFATKKNAMLELKTKTAFVDHLLDLKHAGRTTFAWSVNTPSVIASEERGTASLEERLAAAKKVSDAGYGIAFHFDPIIIVGDVEKEASEYLSVIDRILSTFESKRISWISLGLLRYPKDLPSLSMKRFPSTRIFAGEMIPTGAKMRYLRFVREKVYNLLWQRLKDKLPPHKLYLCMETIPVWQKVDPAVSSNSCIEKRLCNLENIAFDYKW